MNTEITISSAAASEVILLIENCLRESRAGFDYNLLTEAMIALGEADRIIIEVTHD